MKKSMKKILFASMVMAVSIFGSQWFFGAGYVRAEDTQVTQDGFEYQTFTQDGETYAKITGYTGEEENITIPAQAGGYAVYSITERAFFRMKNLKNVTIAEGIVLIANSAFSESGIQSITIPASVTTIGELGVFEYCNNLTDINVAEGNAQFASVDGVVYTKDKKTLYLYPCGREGAYTVIDGTESIGASAFWGCKKLTDVTLPSSVTELVKNAFSWSGVTSVNLPDGLTSIGAAAFMSARNLRSISIPAATASIGRCAFESCDSLEEIQVAAGNGSYSSEDGVLYNKGKTNVIVCPCGKTGTYSMPDTVTSLSDFAFQECKKITEITLSTKLTTLGEYAFDSCTSIRTVTIPSGVTTLSNSAFNGCTDLVSITLPGGLTTIKARALSGCQSLTELNLPAKVTSIDKTAFCSCSALTGISIASSNTKYLTVDGKLYDKGKTRLICCPAGTEGAYAIPEGVTAIDTTAFEGCDKITEITIPSTITSITSSMITTLRKCENMTDVEVPENHSVYRSIDGVLFNADGIEVMYCPPGKTGTYTVPDGTSVIKENAFTLCDKLSGVILPDSLTKIETHAFKSCGALKHVTIPDSVTRLPEYAFDDTPLESIMIPESVVGISTQAIGWKSIDIWDWEKLPVQPVVHCFKDSYAQEFAAANELETVLYTRLTKDMITLPDNSVYTGAPCRPEPEIKDGNETLQEDTDYEIIGYVNNVNAGEASVTIAGKGSYVGEVTKTFEIQKAVPSYRVPQKITVYTEVKLSEAALPDADNGTWSWQDGNTEIAMGEHSYPARFLPTDSDNYKSVENIMVTVEKKAQPTQIPAVSQEPTQNPAVSQEPTQNPAVSQEPSQEPAVSQEPSQAPAVSQEPTQNPAVSQKPSQAPAMSQKPSSEPAVSQTPGKPVANTKPVLASNGLSVTTTSKGEASVFGIKSTGKKTITVPAFAEVNGVKYKITVLAAYSFKDTKKEKTVVLPDTIKKVKAKAFAKSKIVTVKFKVKKGAGLSIDKKAFKKSKVKKIKIIFDKKEKKARKKKMIKMFIKAGIKKKNISEAKG